MSKRETGRWRRAEGRNFVIHSVFIFTFPGMLALKPTWISVHRGVTSNVHSTGVWPHQSGVSTRRGRWVVGLPVTAAIFQILFLYLLINIVLMSMWILNKNINHSWSPELNRFYSSLFLLIGFKRFILGLDWGQQIPVQIKRDSCGQ